MRYWVAAVLLVSGLVGLALGFPLRATPSPVEVRFVGPYTGPGLIVVTEPGSYTVWEAGDIRHDGNRCRITTESGAAVAVTAPRLPVRWETDDSDAVDTYTAIGSFDAPGAGMYGIACSVDPATPGTNFVVSSEPDVVPSLVAVVGGAVCVLAGAVVAVLVWRRRRVAVPQNGGPS
jgi:hypothetical protein